SLVVAINTDASARRLGKGPDRPLNREDDRAAMLAALESVSLVTFFDEDTPLQLVRELKPAVLVKGGDYDVDTLEEAQLAVGYGRSLAGAGGQQARGLRTLQQGDVADVGNELAVRRRLRQHQELHGELDVDHAAGAVLDVEAIALDGTRGAHLLAHGDD